MAVSSSLGWAFPAAFSISKSLMIYAEAMYRWMSCEDLVTIGAWNCCA